MKTYNIAISIDDRVTDVISYRSEKKDLKKEMLLIGKFTDAQICNVKSFEQISYHKLKVTSEKDITYIISWRYVTLWDESELEDLEIFVNI